MGRKKQARPRRSGGIIIGSNGQDNTKADCAEENVVPNQKVQKDGLDMSDPPFFVDVERACWALDEHFDISELVLTDLNIRGGFSGFRVEDGFYQSSDYSFRFRVYNVNEFVARIKLGHWPLLSSKDVHLELVEKCSAEKNQKVVLSGSFDGPNEGVSGLVHLASLKFISVRPLEGIAFSEDMTTVRVRVEILKSAFDACESLQDNTRQLWKKSMINVMAWLRPEVMTSEARYGICQSETVGNDLHPDERDSATVNRKDVKFDVSGFYEAIKPSKADPMLGDKIPNLLPKLRPYQRRAAYWMVQREKGALGSSDTQGTSQLVSPLCMTVGFVDSGLKMFYNPFSGNVAMHPEVFSEHVSGGILADEMGLGKTVELLACILSHRWSASESGPCIDAESQLRGESQIHIKRLKRERVECICGAVTESFRYTGLWVQCDVCDAWQHSDCVGYSARGKKVKDGSGQQQREKNVEKFRRKKNVPTIVEREGKYVCQLCLELMSATESPVPSGATLIVCPAPILHQWQTEIIRHTNTDSVKMLVYEGVKNTSFSEEPAVEVDELVSYDIVLTTYDVLKEDLSHDSDRHEGDRRFMRYHKRYPVIPTPLTRIFWWRLCLDEAQMVESNAAAATEMALRLHSKYRWCITGTPIQRRLDDLYGLLKFLKLSPFDVPRWWNEVVRDPYERRDARAMEFTHNLFKQIMWRSSKRHVADELHLPPQEECLSWLSFSAIEEHFYQRQHETCVDYARELIESLKADILKREATGSASSAPSDCIITHVEAAKLLNSLLKLRQACCHPQVGSSGLRSLQKSPMSMEEVLTVLIGKTKIEGEEALRRSVVALNGLAGIAIIEDNPSHAVSLYKEALDLAMEHSEDFSLDPLLNIHIHHNLSEILFKSSNGSLQLQLNDGLIFGIPGNKASKRPYFGECDDEYATKRQKLNGIKDDSSVSNTPKAPTFTSDVSVDASNETNECNAKPSFASNSFSYDYLETVCETFKQKFLSIFNSKLIVAQLDFRKSYEQVCDAFNEVKNQRSVWWLEVLHHIEQSTDSTGELIRKIGEAVLGSTNNSRSSKIGSGFRSIHGLKYYIQTGLDSLEVSRRAVLDRLLEIDETMDKPRDEDIERVGHCQNCQPNGNGPVCILCELDELFQIYEARLFRLSNARGGIIMSAEEALDLQKKKSALNQFYRTLSQANKNSSSTSRDEDITGKRDTGEKVVVSKSPSELEVVLGVIRGYSKVHLGKEGKSAATKQLRLLEDMRKEYASARSLCIAQAQVLRAHDEIKMSTSRLRLREDENDKSLDALSVEELPANNVHYSNEKFMSMALLLRIKGKLRYLKGLVQAKQKVSMESTDNSFLTQDTATCPVSPMEQRNEHSVNACQEACPICHEKLSIQKMVFQCGHVTCCKCLFELTERKQGQAGESQRRWVMCPICRQHTEFENIAYADDRQNKSPNSSGLHESQDSRNEASITVQGSYGTKIEAVTRRILWIKSTEPNSKVLVFSSWKDVLDVLEHAFKANGISYARMKGGRKAHTAVGHFRGQNMSVKVNKREHCEDIQVLLLLVQHGANGLNLLEARHVILVEPLLNPAAEAQAISRVHRIGQENKTLVHRFIVKDSVEESIYKLNKSRNGSSFISGNTKNQDQPVLTLKDVESLFAASPATPLQTDEKPMESLMHLPPSMAAAVAAERRLQEQTAIS
ncbi:E3 ubiquitin-protein ligase SHPRH [Rhodamnia argentea]|uniref:E3 ubiquitin-protein ligase SHPRH n=1 Tax=Rhodamnia argentea TaxID=178133 RepID=A0A8B8Q1Z1_9MYRT|nr:E3 ubiquitin-protein ligase SHPRH [Rhodamnia argentea]